MKGLIIALQFLTRIPLKINLNITEKEFGKLYQIFSFSRIGYRVNFNGHLFSNI